MTDSKTAATTEETTTPLAPETAKTTEANEGPLSWAERVRAEVRQAGELGKAQWKDAFARTRKLLDEARSQLKREELEKVASRVKGEVTQAASRVKGEVTQAWSKVPVAEAQARGADLLLRVVTPVRTFTTSIERSLVEARAAKAAANEQQPVTA